MQNRRSMSTTPILIEKGYWMNSQLSVARFYGGIKYNDKVYKIVNKEGITVEELSTPQSAYYVGKCNYVIPPGEPADLVVEEWIPVYKKFGRKDFISLVEKGVRLEDALKLCKTK